MIQRYSTRRFGGFSGAAAATSVFHFLDLRIDDSSSSIPQVHQFMSNWICGSSPTVLHPAISVVGARSGTI
jgi:hypothetical protein